MSKFVFDVILQGGSAHVVEADKFHPDADGRSVTFASDGERVAQFFGVESAVKRPPAADPMPVLGLCASAVTELGVVDLPPSVSIGVINIAAANPEDVRAHLEACLAAAKESKPIR